jgi:SAM-dependent methyltransferase
MATYSSKIFAVPDEKAARRIILTPQGWTTDQRWEVETPALVELAGPYLDLRPNRVLLDYGCGIGRLSKAFIERFGCHVIGVDISPEMRRLASQYVDSPLFSTLSREAFLDLVRKGLRVHGVICVWVLQHCLDPTVDLSIIRQALRAGGRVFVVNNHLRAVPTDERPFENDGQDVKALLGEQMATVDMGQLSPDQIGPALAPHTFGVSTAARARADRPARRDRSPRPKSTPSPR